MSAHMRDALLGVRERASLASLRTMLPRAHVVPMLPSIETVVACSLALRLLISALHGYGVDEAYAVTVARPLSMSYFDHPPLHFWIAGVFAALWGSTAPFVERFPFVLLFSFTLWCMGRLTALAFSERAGQVATLALATSGVLGIVDGMWVLPDGPLIAAAAAGTYVLAPILLATDPVSPHSARGRWIAAGVLFGLAGLAKYHAALLVLGLATYMCTDRTARRQLHTSGPWLALMLMLACSTPVIWWNATNHWASFAFQSGRAAPRVFSVVPMVEGVVGQALWMLPWIFLPLAVAFARALKAGPRLRQSWLFVCLAMWPVLVFTLVPLGGSRGLPHWPAPGWLFAFPLLGAAIDRALREGATWPITWLRASTVATGAIVSLLVALITIPALSAMAAGGRSPDPAADLISWRPVADAVARAQADKPSAVLATRSWIQAGQIGSAFATPPAIVCLCSDPHHLAWRAPSDSLWTELILVDRVQPYRRGWTSPEVAFGDSLWRVVPLDTVRLGRGVRVTVHHVSRRP